MQLASTHRRLHLLERLFPDTPNQCRIAAATIQYLSRKFGKPDEENAWRYLMAAVTYFQDTPGGPLSMVPNVTDQTRVWNTGSKQPKILYAGAQHVAELLAADFGVDSSNQAWLTILEKKLSVYFQLRAWAESGRNPHQCAGRRLRNPNQRNVWVGDGFEQILFVLAAEIASAASVEGLEIGFKVRPERVVGFQLRVSGGRQRFPVSDITVQNPHLRAVVSAKVGLRVDRTRGELDAALTLARVRPECYYLLVTSEYDTGCLRLLASEPSIARVYHVNKSYLVRFWEAIPNRGDEAAWVRVAVADLQDFFSDIATLGRPAI